MSTIVITGANRGIGLALAGRFTDRGDDVIAVCRETSSQLDALGAEVLAGIDVTDSASLARLTEHTAGRAIDILVNNAGVMRPTSLAEIETQLEAYRLQFEVNALAPLRVTHALLERFASGAKVAIITSRMGSIADNDSGGHYGYRMSKAAVNIAGVSLARDLSGRGIAVGLLHPGYVRTGMTGHTGHVETDQAAAGLVGRIDELDMASTGGFRHADGQALPW